MTQAGFGHAILNPDAPVPAGLVDPEGRVSVKRFNVYRNNVVASLADALVAAFPAVHKLVGDPFFRAMAKLYLCDHPPASPVLAHYGAAFPNFLRGFRPAAHLRYLPDVARLEILLRESYHAADHSPLDPAALTDLAPEDLGQLRLSLAPSARLLRSDWPVAAIWQKNMADPDTALPEGGQDVIVARAGFDPVPLVLPAGGHAFFNALSLGQPLAAAAATAALDVPDFDPSVALQLAFAQNLFAASPPAPTPET